MQCAGVSLCAGAVAGGSVFGGFVYRWEAERVQDEVYTNIVRAADVPAAGLNLDVVKVEVSGEIPKKYRALWKEQAAVAAGKLPWLVVEYPAAVGDERRVMWSGGWSRRMLLRC